MLRKLLYISTVALLLAGCFVSTYTKDWDIVWDQEAIAQKQDFLAGIDKVEDKPNVIIILADDLGKYEVSAYGAEHISTPNIDAIGTNGVRFQEAYVTAPICAPSRAAILTGRYQQRYGFETQPMDFYPTNVLEYSVGKKSDLGDWHITAEGDFPSPWMVDRQGIPPNEINIAELYQAAGYSTAIVGKWHLGAGEEHLPNNRGFDYQYGFYGAFSLYTPKQNTAGYVNFIQDDMSSQHQWGMKRNESAAIRENDEVVKEEDYLTFAIKDRAKEFVTAQKDSNFFLYLSFSAPHVPFQAPESYYNQFEHIEDKNQRVYLAMIKAMDDAIGDFMQHLENEGLAENTIVYFISDNGGASYTGATDNGPLKGGKITHFEGGVNVPFMMQWKGHIPAGTVFEHPVSSMDIFTTSLNACGIPLPKGVKIDGRDLMPFIKKDVEGQPHEKLYWRTDHIHAIRYQKWKLILSTRDEWMHLYNLESDKSEKIDLKDLNADEKQMLLRFFEEWDEELPQDYLWPRIMDRKFILGDKTYFFPA
ncbi:MAG: sulfatase-like hydrolase/transferase [Crocinitomicaceae bacterium]|nr:sulfatase-like hydrolase/transferase [Crocinitomicaceae bacterium]